MCTTKHLPGQTSAARTFDREANSVPTARRWATGIYANFGAADEVLDTCELLVSEVVTNAVKYGSGNQYTVVVDSDLWIEVWEESRELPQRRERDLEAEGGRGLELLDMLAPGYQVIRDTVHGGKCVRFLPKGWA